MPQAKSIWSTIAKSLAKGGTHATYYSPGSGGRRLITHMEHVTAVPDINLACRLALLRSRSSQPAVVSVGPGAGVLDAAALYDAVHYGTGAGMVMVVVSAEQVAVPGVMWLQPFDERSAMSLSRAALGLSRQFDLPVALSLKRFFGPHPAARTVFPTARRILEIAACFAGKQFIASSTSTTLAGIRQPSSDQKHAAVARFAEELERQIIVLE